MGGRGFILWFGHCKSREESSVRLFWKGEVWFLFSLLLLFTFGVEHELRASPMLRACSAVSGTLATEEDLLMDTGPELQTRHRHGKSSWGQCCHPLESLYRKCPHMALFQAAGSSP